MSLSLDFGTGAGRSKEHQAAFGPWGVSLRAQSDLAWTIRPGHELHASYEYEYNQFNPALQSSSAQAWSMIQLTAFYRWAAE